MPSGINSPADHYNLNLGSSPAAGVLAARGHDTARGVVERNGEILPRERFAQTLLCGGDSLEIVHFVGGG